MDTAIFVNDNLPSHTTMRGVTRHARHVVDGLVARWGAQVTIYSPDARAYAPARYIHALRFRGIRRFGLHDRIASIEAGRAAPVVVFNTFFGEMRTSAPEVFTVYDLLLERMTREGDPNGWQQHKYVAEARRCLERGARILTLSQNTARDLAAVYPHISPSKIRVTYPGVDPVFLEAADRPPPPGRPYLLYVGERAGHKNFTRLLEAFARSGLSRDMRLHVISRVQTWSEAETALMHRYKLADSVQLKPPVSDVELRRAYTGAVALVYPSLQEGFGLPILEAQASGTLVATAAASSMPEAGGEAAFYFDPQSAESIGACLRRIADLSPQARRLRIAQGKARAVEFTWERCQKQTNAVFEELLAPIGRPEAAT